MCNNKKYQHSFFMKNSGLIDKNLRILGNQGK